MELVLLFLLLLLSLLRCVHSDSSSCSIKRCILDPLSPWYFELALLAVPGQTRVSHRLSIAASADMSLNHEASMLPDPPKVL